MGQGVSVDFNYSGGSFDAGVSNSYGTRVGWDDEHSLNISQSFNHDAGSSSLKLGLDSSSISHFEPFTKSYGDISFDYGGHFNTKFGNSYLDK